MAVTLALLGLGVPVLRQAGRVPDREEVFAILVEAGVSGQPVQEVVRVRGLRPIDWGRAFHRDAGDPGFEPELRRRLADGLRAAAEKAPKPAP